MWRSVLGRYRAGRSASHRGQEILIASVLTTVVVTCIVGGRRRQRDAIIAVREWWNVNLDTHHRFSR